MAGHLLRFKKLNVSSHFSSQPGCDALSLSISILSIECHFANKRYCCGDQSGRKGEHGELSSVAYLSCSANCSPASNVTSIAFQLAGKSGRL